MASELLVGASILTSDSCSGRSEEEEEEEEDEEKEDPEDDELILKKAIFVNVCKFYLLSIAN
jgi:hypothetical protein